MCISFEVFVTRTAGGADFTIDYTKDGWQKEVLKITGGQGVDVVYGSVRKIKSKVCTQAPILVFSPQSHLPRNGSLRNVPYAL